MTVRPADCSKLGMVVTSLPLVLGANVLLPRLVDTAVPPHHVQRDAFDGEVREGLLPGRGPTSAGPRLVFGEESTPEMMDPSLECSGEGVRSVPMKVSRA